VAKLRNGHEQQENVSPMASRGHLRKKEKSPDRTGGKMIRDWADLPRIRRREKKSVWGKKGKGSAYKKKGNGLVADAKGKLAMHRLEKKRPNEGRGRGGGCHCEDKGSLND